MTTVLVAERYVVRARRLTLIDAARLLPYAAGLSAALSIALVSVKVWRTPHFAHVSIVVSSALSAFAISLVCAALLRRLSPSSLGLIKDGGLTSWLLAIELGILLLPVPVLLLVKSVPEEDMTGWLWPLVNKRWLLALCNIAIATFGVFPVAIARWRLSAIEEATLPLRVQEQPPSRRRNLSLITGCVVVLATCWYVAGPPWHIDRYHLSIEWHEQMHFGALQSISKGYLPAVGPAATAYGPGAQVLTYALATLTGPLDLVSIRNAWTAQQLLALIIVGAAAFWWLGTIPALAVVALAITYSPLAFFYTLNDGTYTGFFGWANPLRTIVPLIVVVAVARAALIESTAPAAVVLGAVWGIGAWVAQESLTSTAVGAGLLLTLLYLTRTIPAAKAVWLVRNLLIGFVCVVIPVVGYYASRGAAGGLLEAYLAYPRAMAAGFGNDWWPLQDKANPARLSYYLTLPFLIGCAICTLWRFPRLQLVTPLGPRRARFLALICVQLVCYQTVLLRSDSSHLMNSMIALPFVLVVGFMDLPRWLAREASGRWVARIAFVILSVIVFPSLILTTDITGFSAPLRRFRADAPRVALGSQNDRLSVFARTRPLALHEPMFVGDSSLSVREFDDFAADLRALIGARKTYVVRIGWIAGGLIAFVADLIPAPHPLGGDLFTFNDQVRRRIADHISGHPSDYEAFIGPSLSDPEAQAFLESHPGAVKLEKRFGTSTVWILLSSALRSKR